MTNLMISIIINGLILLFTYLLIFIIYYTSVVFSGKHIGKFLNKIDKTKVHEQKLAVIVYASNNIKNHDITRLLETLNNQEYEKNNYSLNIILDGCDDETANMLEFIGGARIYRTGTPNAPIGKDVAISDVLERALVTSNAEGYVFLNANRMVSERFLSSVNIALNLNPVVVGLTQIANKPLTLYEKVVKAILDYNNIIINLGRSVLNLATKLDSDICAIRLEVLNEVKSIDFSSDENELKYTFLLAKFGFAPVFNPYIVTKIDSDKFTLKNIGLKCKLNLFLKCLPLIFTSFNKKFTELTFSLISPNYIFALCIYAAVFAFSYTYVFTYDIKFVCFIGAIGILSFIASLYFVKFNAKEIYYLLLSPFINNLKKHEIAYHQKLELKKAQNPIEKMIVNAVVSDGRIELNCELDLIQEDGMSKVVFKFKQKKYETDSFLRMYDAIADITKKLKTHGFNLKICQNCKYFTPHIDGSTNMIKGFCTRPVMEDDRLFDDKKLLWQCCKNYIIKDKDNIVEISKLKNKAE